MKQKRLLTLLAIGVGGWYAWKYFKDRQQATGQPTNGKVQRVIDSGGNLIKQFTDLVNAITKPRSGTLDVNENGQVPEDNSATEILK